MIAFRSLDSRAWIIWGAAAMLPLILGRNPWVSGEVLLCVLFVRFAWRVDEETHAASWFLRIAGFMALVSIVFNTLTVHAGDHVIATLPSSWPVIGGNLTWNAVLYGAVSAVTLFGLVLMGFTVAGLIRWVDLFHLLPPRLAPIAVTGSVAWAFVPQTAIAYTNIREAMTMRGHRFQNARDFLPILVPLLASGLERSLTMAEALEARGFGSSLSPSSQTQGKREPSILSLTLLVAGLMLLAMAAYCFAIAEALMGTAALGAGVLAMAVFTRLSPAPARVTTRYRAHSLSRNDWSVIISAAIVGISTVVWSVMSPEAFLFSTYPSITMPRVEPILMLLLSMLLIPAFLVTPAEPTP